ncbi:MAG: RDD family protein [Halobacteriales archaeon]|nr:RDD family protein [Halobacteriales archaeon]
MKLSAEGQAWLNATVQRVMARHHVAEAERAGLHYELMSHLHGAGEEKARSAGRDEVSMGDLQAGLLDMGGEEAMAQAFVAPRAKPPKRADIVKRAIAYLIDLVIVFLAWMAVAAIIDITLSVLLLPFGGTFGGFDPFDVFGSPFKGRGFIPAGFGLVFVVILGYFTWTEGKAGASLGKRIFKLKVVRVDGTPIGYREALIRNVTKVFPPLAFLDALFILVFFRAEQQRASDRLAETVVVEE